MKKDLQRGFIPKVGIYMTNIDHIDMKVKRDKLNFRVFSQICISNNCKADIKTYDTIGDMFIIEQFNLPSISYQEFLFYMEKANGSARYMEEIEKTPVVKIVKNKFQTFNKQTNEDNVVFVDFKAKKRVS